MKVWCVQHRDGWCAVKGNYRPSELDAQVPTCCQMFVTLPLGIERRMPTCFQCHTQLPKRKVKSMKMKLWLLALLWLVSWTGLSAEVTLAWDAGSSNGVVGYKVYWGPAHTAYTNSVSTGNVLSVTVSNLTVGATYYFAATTLDVFGLESDYSGELVYIVPLPPPKNARAILEEDGP